MEPDKILATVIQDEMQLPEGRIVLYNQDFIAPKDKEIYITIALFSSKIISSNKEFDPILREEIKNVVMSEKYHIEITSKNTDAKNRYPQVVAALTSTFSVQLQELEHVSIYRSDQEPIDLSVIEGGSSLHRYQITAIITSMKTYKKTVSTFDQFQTTEVITDA